MPRVQRPVDVAEAVNGVMRALGERVRPVAMARERVLPVHPVLAPLFPDGGPARGMVVGCEGEAPLSAAMAVVAEASQAGAWVGVTGLPAFGVAAAVEWGVAAERIVWVADPPAEHLPAVLATLVDGVEVVMLGAGVAVRAGDARRLAARLAARGGVLVVVGRSGAFTPDLVCRVVSARWEGLEAGAGRLTARRAVVEASGRRVGRPRRVEAWFPGPSGALAPVADSAAGSGSGAARPWPAGGSFVASLADESIPNRSRPLGEVGAGAVARAG